MEFSAGRMPCVLVLLPLGGDHIGHSCRWRRCHKVVVVGGGSSSRPPLCLVAVVCRGGRASVLGHVLPLLLHRDVESHGYLGILDLGDTNAP